ncbi:hypothetical protein C8R47DRAFT_1227319 [Mycena vitilis]|nr:hypothetical protein C8R47DRAFT_1227319 [Mycena vitilis]
MYLSKEEAAALAKSKAAKALRPTLIDNAIVNGALPVHEPPPPSGSAQITDFDPTPEECDAFSMVLAHNNQQCTLVTLAKPGDKHWTNFPYPSHTTAGFERYTAPSGFKKLTDDELPKCAHRSNPYRTDLECTMRPHVRKTRHDGDVVFLQVDPHFHACPFIAVIRKRDPRPLHVQGIKAAVKQEPKAARRLLSLKTALPTAKEGVLGRRRPALSRQNALASIAGPSRLASPPRARSSSTRSSRTNALAGPSRLASPPRAPNVLAREVIDVDALDDPPPSSSVPSSSPPSSSVPSSSPATSSPWTSRPFNPSGPRGRATNQIKLYTVREALFNAVGSDALKQETAASRAHLADTKNYATSPWLADSPGRRPTPNSRTLLPRLLPYASGGELADRIAMATPVGPHPLTKFLFSLATTDGVSGEAYTFFFSMLRQCACCKLHFTPYSFNQHLLRSEDVYVCKNHPAHNIVSPVAPVPYGPLTEKRRHSLGHHPAKRHRASPYAEFGSLTALGIALTALDTRLGLPDDIFQAVRVALVPCADCARFRTVHAHLAHLAGGVCSDIGPGESSFIAVSSDRAIEVDGAGKRTTILIPEDA